MGRTNEESVLGLQHVQAKAIDTTGVTAGQRDADIDEKLLGRIQAGDRSAWPALVDRHLGHVFGYAYRVLGDHAEAEDVAQETFLRLMAKTRTWRKDGARLRTWLYRVAVNLSIDHKRRMRPGSLSDIADPPHPGHDEAGMVRGLDCSKALRRALDGLGEHQRQALLLVHYQGFSNKEASAILGISTRALESRLARARRALRRDLAPVMAELIGEE